MKVSYLWQIPRMFLPESLLDNPHNTDIPTWGFGKHEDGIYANMMGNYPVGILIQSMGIDQHQQADLTGGRSHSWRNLSAIFRLVNVSESL